MIIRRPGVVTTDIVKDGDEILVYEHYEGNLVFEYDKNRGADKKAYKVFENVWEELK